MTLRIELEHDCLKVWPENNHASVYDVARVLEQWGFWVDRNGPRPLNKREAKLSNDIRSALPGISQMLEDRGVTWIEPPVTARRDREESGGRAFDELKAELEGRNALGTLSDLENLLKAIRLRNLPAGRSAHHYFM